ncbi:MAG: aldo/keto reductase [Oscillospiraceae bacterium]|nr:aldo/keto reductase [Oscillospiraceae bacterium]
MKNYFGMPIKKLGFGFMRLPGFAGKPDSEIDIERVKKMVDLYMERDFTYFDTAFGYHGGNSEVAIRQAVVERFPRDKFQVTTKLPLWEQLSMDEMKGRTQTSLERAGLDYFDLYFLHGVGPDRFEMIENMKAWDYLRSVKDSGKAKNIGFSYHGDGDSLNRLLDVHAKDLDIVQLQINYLDWETQAQKCYQAARDHDMGIIVMSPVKGGSLSNFTPEVADIFKKANPDASIASWALRFPMNLEGIVTVLSGMSTIEQVDDNTKIADTMGPFSDAEKKVIENAMEALKQIPTIPCTSCRYCVEDCPSKINIPGILNLLNDHAKYQNLSGEKRFYGFVTGGMMGGTAGKASDCVGCEKCEHICPQDIKIVNHMKEAAALFE